MEGGPGIPGVGLLSGRSDGFVQRIEDAGHVAIHVNLGARWRVAPVSPELAFYPGDRHNVCLTGEC